MSLATQVQSLATRIATEFKTVRSEITTKIGALTSLTTSDKTNVVAAINEVKGIADAATGGSGGATTLDGLTDVVIAGPAAGHMLRHNGTNFVNVLGTTYFEVAGAAAAAQAASQPLDTDLTAIAALSTTAYGRAFLALANQAGLMALLAPGTETSSGILELATTTEATTGTDTTRAVTPAGVAAAINSLVAGAPGLLNTLDELAAALGDDPNFATTITSSLAGKQALDADLTAIAALTSAADKVPLATGAGTWTMMTVTAAARTILDDADVAAMRTTLDVYSKTEVGDPATDFVATFNAGLI